MEERLQLIQEIEALIPELSQEDIIDCFQPDMEFDNYFTDAEGNESDWEDAGDWLKHHLYDAINPPSVHNLKEALDYWKASPQLGR